MRKYLLGNLVRCAFCGERMWAQSANKSSQYYIDTAKRRGLLCYNPGAWVQAKELDAQIDALVRSLKLPAAWQMQVDEIVRNSEERAVVKRDAERVQEKLRRLNEQYRELSVTKAEYEYHRKRLEAELSALVVPPPVPKAIAGETLEQMLTIWDAATREERSELVSLMFETVYVDTIAREIIAYRPKEDYRGLFMLCDGLHEEAGLLVTDRYYEVIGIGDPGGSRTHNARIKSPMLCH
jgi:hypothetical protein